MVFTVTLNPAMDRTLILEGLRIDEVNRVTSTRTDIGGKGINVSKVLKALGTPSIAMGFIGENHKEIFRSELNRHGITNRLITIEGETRTNIKIADKKNATFTDLNEAGPVISKDELNKFMQLFEDLVKKEDIVVLSGRVPLGIPQGIYGLLTKKSLEKGAYVIVDAEGESLELAVSQKPHVMKPNEQELCILAGKEKLTEKEIIREANKLVQSGIEKVLVSRGEKGSVLVTKDHVLISEPLNAEVKSTVGAGDAMVAAIVYAKVEKLDDVQTLAIALSAATAVVMTEGTRVPRPRDITEHLDEMKRRIHEVHKI